MWSHTFAFSAYEYQFPVVEWEQLWQQHLHLNVWKGNFRALFSMLVFIIGRLASDFSGLTSEAAPGLAPLQAGAVVVLDHSREAEADCRHSQNCIVCGTEPTKFPSQQPEPLAVKVSPYTVGKIDRSCECFDSLSWRRGMLKRSDS